ncbi:polyribonucleotide nucleotidyltransferase [Desulfofundulus thermobenzoicus]|uniref:Polyribonucleotide nucleotidyltransferase n=1 Tax=Desulfofundulus thermobenzoicus TaxID=29376 RepID=A0A6N7ISG5_9FIRM|nr:polyribonucleotide nucleotidyltransferase [Desulfofundulus thermobenzoicus]MQL52449.1 polyribonucleotide nucleotidyltransferase [Desulfofundulus thermobenzoicus]HHW44164.1 polyribonucleotide nucleotidyltransferase [Desulfotomaculum sp.]
MAEQPILIREMEVGGRTLQLETGRVAGQAGGAVLVRYGDTVVLVTATMAKNPREGIDFFPLTVDYEERLYAVGKIPGGFIKREGRPSEKAVLSARLIDRPIRPLFPKGCRNEVQVVATVLSVDQDNAPEIAAMVGASAALHISEIPFQGPIGGVIVGLVDGEYVINPTLAQSEKNLMHLVVAGTADAVMMVEAGAKEVPEEQMLRGISFGHEKVKEIVQFIEDFRREALALGLAKEKVTPVLAVVEPEIEEAVSGPALEALTGAVRQCIEQRLDKKAREALLEEVKTKLVESFQETFPEKDASIAAVVDAVEKKVVRQFILEEKIRIDGRALHEIRPISVEVGVLPRTHGSGLFTRGQTQVLSVVTLGAISDEQILDGLGIEETKRFMHHYNFPPYSTGETRPMRSPGRREIGHGALAERALEPVIPGEDAFPYTIRIVSEVLSSNGSTSMGSVCGSTLALMDAGIPIKAPVAGVAMGLIKEDDRVAVLTDIQGVEDHLGDMDFKVAGTARGVTALQMDIKVPGVTEEILEKALAQAHEGRMYILGKMLEVISAPRPELSPYAPRILHTVIDPDKIREVIGPGGKIIKKIIDETGVEIDIEDDGRVFIAAVDPAAGQRALDIIESITKDVVTGEVYTGRVTRVTDFGAFVEIVPGVLGLPGKEGLVHISQLAHHRVNKVEDVLKEGDTVLVKAIGYDNQGRLKLSRKEALPPEPRDSRESRENSGATHQRRPSRARHGRH